MKKILLVLGAAPAALALILATSLAGPSTANDHGSARSMAIHVTLASRQQLQPTSARSPAMTSKGYAGYVVRQTGRSFQFVQTACRRSSAEVISEATPASGVIQPLADYGAESFASISVTDSRGHHAGFYARWWRTIEITQIGMTTSKVIGQPTGLHLGTSFDNYWLGSS